MGLCVLLVSTVEGNARAQVCGASDGEEQPRFFMAVHIGKEIQRVMEQRGISVAQLARDYGCSRIHMYRIFEKTSLDTTMLMRFSSLLAFDFFSLYSKELRERTGVSS